MTARSIEDYMKLPYEIELIRDEEGDGWVARVRELSGCLSQGDTKEEAAEMIRDAMRGWLESALRHGDPIPEPISNATGKQHPQIRGKLVRVLDRPTGGVQVEGLCAELARIRYLVVNTWSPTESVTLWRGTPSGSFEVKWGRSGKPLKAWTQSRASGRRREGARKRKERALKPQ